MYRPCLLSVNLPHRFLIPPVFVMRPLSFFPMHTSQYTVCTYANTGCIPTKPTKKHYQETKKQHLSNLTAFLQTPSGDYSASLKKKKKKSLYMWRQLFRIEAYGTDRCINSLQMISE